MATLPEPLQLLLDTPPDEFTWYCLCRRLEALPDSEVAALVPALDERLASFPDEMRILPFNSWQERWEKGEAPPAWPLVRTLRVTSALPAKVLAGEGIAHLTGLIAMWLSGKGASTLQSLASAGAPLPFKRLTIDSHREEIAAPAVVAALKSAALPHLSFFALEGCHFSDAAVKDLAKEPALSKLRGLALRGGVLKAPGLKALLKSKHLGPLEELDVYNNSLGKPGCREIGPLLAARKLPLRALRAGGNRSTRDEFAALMASPLPATLRELEWGFQGASDDPLIDALGRPDCPLLEEIEFTSGSLTAKGLAALSGSPKCNGLRSLLLNMTTFGPDGVRALVSGGELGRLEVLNLSMTDSYPPSDAMGPAVIELIESPKLASLRTLWLTHVPLGDSVVDALIAAPALLSRLVSLRLGWTGLSEVAMTQLCEALRGGAPRLCDLELSKNVEAPGEELLRAVEALRAAGVDVSV